MLVVETIAKIRRAYFQDGKPIKQICRELRVSRKTVRKVIRSGATEFVYERSVQPLPKIGPWQDKLDVMLAENAGRPKRERLTHIRIFEELRSLGYDGGYDAVRRYAAGWSTAESEASAEAHVPLSFDSGEAYQFDWSHEVVLIDGVTTTVKVAHVRLCHSRMPFIRAYPRETRGRWSSMPTTRLSPSSAAPARVESMTVRRGAAIGPRPMPDKTAVDTIFVGRDRTYNRRFQQMCGHYLVEPPKRSARTDRAPRFGPAPRPRAGTAPAWRHRFEPAGAGQVENQAGVIRRRFFVPRPRFKSYAELNAWLEDRCVAWAKAHPHPELRDRTIWEVFEEERASLVPYVGPFDGFHAVPAPVSKTCLVRFDTNRYSVDARAVGRPVEIRAYAERVEFWQGGKVVGAHPRAFGRGKTVYNPLHYIPVLVRKPGALRSEPRGRHRFQTRGERTVQGLGIAAGAAARAAQARPRAER
jgi:hypothetical protein